MALGAEDKVFEADGQRMPEGFKKRKQKKKKGGKFKKLRRRFSKRKDRDIPPDDDPGPCDANANLNPKAKGPPEKAAVGNDEAKPPDKDHDTATGCFGKAFSRARDHFRDYVKEKRDKLLNNFPLLVKMCDRKGQDIDIVESAPASPFRVPSGVFLVAEQGADPEAKMATQAKIRERWLGFAQKPLPPIGQVAPPVAWDIVDEVAGTLRPPSRYAQIRPPSRYATSPPPDADYVPRPRRLNRLDNALAFSNVEPRYTNAPLTRNEVILKIKDKKKKCARVLKTKHINEMVKRDARHRTFVSARISSLITRSDPAGQQRFDEVAALRKAIRDGKVTFPEDAPQNAKAVNRVFGHED